MLQSEIDLMRMIRDCPNHVLELPNGSIPDYWETLQYLIDHRYVHLHPPHRTHPDTCLYTLERDGLLAIEEFDELRKKDAAEKHQHTVDRRIAFLSPILLLIGLVVDNWSAIWNFILSVLRFFHR